MMTSLTLTDVAQKGAHLRLAHLQIDLTRSGDLITKVLTYCACAVSQAQGWDFAGIIANPHVILAKWTLLCT